MKQMKCFLLFFVIVLTWVSLNIEGALASTYPSSVAWNNSLYGLSTEEEVDNKDIGNQIGEIKRQRTPMPLKNGESNEKLVGSLLFEIKGANTQDVIAVKINDKFFKASKFGSIQESNEQTWIVALLIICFLVLFTLIIIWRKRRRKS
jgi:hypothetical protein